MRACGPFFVPRNGMYIVHVRAKSIYDGRMCEKKVVMKTKEQTKNGILLANECDCKRYQKGGNDDGTVFVDRNKRLIVIALQIYEKHDRMHFRCII